MIKQRKIELLAPAKNLECGIEAINHGAERDGGDDSCTLSDWRRRADCAGHGDHEVESSSDTASCQYTNGQPYTGKSKIPLEGGFPASSPGAGTIVA